MQDLENKAAFVTGGASGMGLAMARSLGRAGMRVAIADVEWPALEAAAASLCAEALDIWPVRVDVSGRAAMEQAAEATVAHFGKVHVLCNNARAASAHRRGALRSPATLSGCVLRGCRTGSGTTRVHRRTSAEARGPARIVDGSASLPRRGVD